MTYLEAVRMALVEMGTTEDEIGAIMKAGDFMFPMAELNHEMKLRPGETERDLVNEFKQLFTRYDALPEAEKNNVRAYLDDESEKLSRNN